MSVELEMYRRAEAGLMPAEALPRYPRHQLLVQLHDRGLSVAEIAALTATDSVVVVRVLAEHGRSWRDPKDYADVP